MYTRRHELNIVILMSTERRVRLGSYMQCDTRRGRATEAIPRRDLARERQRQLFGETLCLVSGLTARPHNTHHIMSDKPIPPPAEGAASATVENVAAKAAAAPKALPEQNAAFRMMGRCIATAESQATKMRYGSIHTNSHILQASLASASLRATG